MPLTTIMSTQPSGVAFSRNLYSSITSSGISLSLTLAYSGHFNGVMRKKLAKSAVANFAPGVEMTELRKILISNKLAAGVPTSSG